MFSLTICSLATSCCAVCVAANCSQSRTAPLRWCEKIAHVGVVSWMCSPLVISRADLSDRLTVEGGKVLEDLDAVDLICVETWPVA